MEDIIDLAGSNILLISAAYAGDLPKIQSFITKGVDVNIKNNKGETLLMQIAALSNRVDIARFLIERGNAYIDAIDNKGYTALMKAVEGNNVEMVRLLYCKRASVFIKNNDCKTVVDLVNEDTDIYIKACLQKRFDEVEIIISFLDDLLKEHPRLLGATTEDLGILFMLPSLNETDFIMAAYNKNMWNPIDLWEKIVAISLVDIIEKSAPRDCRTDSEESLYSLDSKKHNTSPEIEVLGDVDEI